MSAFELSGSCEPSGLVAGVRHDPFGGDNFAIVEVTASVGGRWPLI